MACCLFSFLFDTAHSYPKCPTGFGSCNMSSFALPLGFTQTFKFSLAFLSMTTSDHKLLTLRFHFKSIKHIFSKQIALGMLDNNTTK